MRLLTAALAAVLFVLVPDAAAAQEGGVTMSGFELDTLSLRPGDAVKVQIWREPDLTGEFPVDEAGRVTFPLLGELTVTGMPVRALRDTLMTRYREHVRNPSIVIIPLRRIIITGEVHRPGLYALDPTISLGGAIALAGGATPNGDPAHIILVRSGQDQGERIGAGQTLSRMRIASGDQVTVMRRSWFDRNSTFLVSAMLSVTSIVVSLIATRSQSSEP
jgi:protein involved in polysaccharide export with SLBB domain